MNNSLRKGVFRRFFWWCLQYFVPWWRIFLLVASFVLLLFFTKDAVIKFVCVKTFADLGFEFCPNKKIKGEIIDNLEELGRIMDTLEYYYSKLDSTVRIKLESRRPAITRRRTCEEYWRPFREIEEIENAKIDRINAQMDKIESNTSSREWIQENRGDINGKLEDIYGFYKELIPYLNALSRSMVAYKSGQSAESRKELREADQEVCKFLMSRFSLAGEIETLISTLIDLGKEWGYPKLNDPEYDPRYKETRRERRECEFTHVLDELNTLIKHGKYFEGNKNFGGTSKEAKRACYQRVTLSSARDPLPYSRDLWDDWPDHHPRLKGMLWTQGVESMKVFIFENLATDTGLTVEEVFRELYDLREEFLDLRSEAREYLEERSEKFQMQINDDDIEDINYLNKELCRFYVNYPEDELLQLYANLEDEREGLDINRLSCRDYERQCSDFYGRRSSKILCYQ